MNGSFPHIRFQNEDEYLHCVIKQAEIIAFDKPGVCGFVCVRACCYRAFPSIYSAPGQDLNWRSFHFFRGEKQLNSIL